jgi:sugar lactone lactonase YvrE
MLKVMKINGEMGKTAILIALILVACAICAGAQSAPSVVVSSTVAVNTSGATNTGKAVQDTCGNVYELESSGSLMEIPFGSEAAQSISLPPHGLASTGSWGIAIDNNNNLYVGGMDGWWSGGHLWKIPSSNCVPQVSNATDLYSNLGSLGAISYWSAPNGVTVDGSGNIFLSTSISCCTSTANWIVEITPSNTAIAVVSNYANTLSSMAVDANDNVFFTVGWSGVVYEVPASSYNSTTTGTPVAVISSGLQTALGLAFDSAGNLYVGDSGTGSIYEVPFTTNGSSTTPALQFDSMYLLAKGAPIGAPLTISHDNTSFFFGNNNPYVYQQALGSANIGLVDVGSSGTAIVDVVFNATVTPTAFTLYPAGGQYTITNGSSPCTTGTAYTAGQSCNAIITFNPATPGTAMAGAVVAGSGGTPLATLYVSGIGGGAGLTLDSGAVTSVGAGFTSPASIALDAAGNTYIADTGKNAVYEFTPGSTTAISIGSNLSKPAGVAVDGAGNVIIADTGNNQIVEVPIVGGAPSNTAQVAIVSSSTSIAGSKLSGPAGVTVDGQGNLYIADTGNNRIVFVPYNGNWNLAEATVLGSNFTSPLATTVDPWGNLYVADSGSGQIYKLPAPFSSAVQQLVAVGYSNPSALATDASGSLFVVDQGADTILRIPNVSGSLNPNLAIEVGFGIAAPYGLVLDPAGDLYVTDSTHAAAYEVNRISTTEAFGDWAVGSPSGALPVKVENEGNQTLNFASQYYVATIGTGSSGDFSLGTPTGAMPACANSGTVLAGSSCEMDFIFDPQASGTRSQTFQLESNATNAVAPQVYVTGIGISATATSTALAITSPASGTPSFGQAITLTATVTAASGTPTGSAQLLVDGVIVAQAALSSGVATFSLPLGLTGGSHSLQAVYLGTTSFEGSSSSIKTISVSTTATTSTLAITAPFINPYSALPGNTVSFTVTINFAGVGIPTGTVQFVTGATTLGTVNVVPVAGGAFQASLATTALPVGTDLVTATYSGDANYVTSSVSGTVTVVSSSTLTTTASGTTLSSSSSSNGSVIFSATSYGGWNGMVGFSCLASSLPANARCVWSPGQVEVIPSTPLTSTVIPTATLIVTIDQPPQTPTASKMIWWLGGVTGLLLFYARRRMSRRGWGTAAMLIALILLGISASGLTACNHGPQFITPSGASTITIYASADPFTVMPSPSTPTPATQACGIIPGSNPPTGSPTLSPCTQQSFQITLTVQ